MPPAFAIGLAFQGTLSNIASGVMLLVFRPFKVDDVINAAGVTGKVIEIGLFTTSFDTLDNRRIFVPNALIFGGTIENVTFHETRRVDVSVGTDYGADLDEVRAVLERSTRVRRGHPRRPRVPDLLCWNSARPRSTGPSGSGAEPTTTGTCARRSPAR